MGINGIKKLLVPAAMLLSLSGFSQLSGEDFDRMDSMIARTAQVPLCKKDGKQDLRFIKRTPEKYSNYKEEFARQMEGAFTFAEKSHFFCDIDVEINCEGKAGNYTFTIEPRTFDQADYENFKQLMAFVEKLRNYTFIPAVNLGENVNSKTSFRFTTRNGKPVVDIIPKKPAAR